MLENSARGFTSQKVRSKDKLCIGISPLAYSLTKGIGKGVKSVQKILVFIA